MKSSVVPHALTGTIVGGNPADQLWVIEGSCRSNPARLTLKASAAETTSYSQILVDEKDIAGWWKCPFKVGDSVLLAEGDGPYQVCGSSLDPGLLLLVGGDNIVLRWPPSKLRDAPKPHDLSRKELNARTFGQPVDVVPSGAVSASDSCSKAHLQTLPRGKLLTGVHKNSLLLDKKNNQLFAVESLDEGFFRLTASYNYFAPKFNGVGQVASTITVQVSQSQLTEDAWELLPFVIGQKVVSTFDPDVMTVVCADRGTYVKAKFSSGGDVLIDASNLRPASEQELAEESKRIRERVVTSGVIETIPTQQAIDQLSIDADLKYIKAMKEKVYQGFSVRVDPIPAQKPLGCARDHTKTVTRHEIEEEYKLLPFSIGNHVNYDKYSWLVIGVEDHKLRIERASNFVGSLARITVDPSEVRSNPVLDQLARGKIEPTPDMCLPKVNDIVVDKEGNPWTVTSIDTETYTVTLSRISLRGVVHSSQSSWSQYRHQWVPTKFCVNQRVLVGGKVATIQSCWTTGLTSGVGLRCEDNRVVARLADLQPVPAPESTAGMYREGGSNELGLVSTRRSPSPYTPYTCPITGIKEGEVAWETQYEFNWPICSDEHDDIKEQVDVEISRMFEKQRAILQHKLHRWPEGLSLKHHTGSTLTQSTANTTVKHKHIQLIWVKENT